MFYINNKNLENFENLRLIIRTVSKIFGNLRLNNKNLTIFGNSEQDFGLKGRLPGYTTFKKKNGFFFKISFFEISL